MFLIYLQSQSDTDSPRQNVYGYYAGKTYQKDFRTYPVCVGIQEDAATEGKLYKSRKVAENAAKNLVKKCTFVSSYQIVELSNGKSEGVTKNI